MARTPGRYKAAAGVNGRSATSARHTGWDVEVSGMSLRVEREEEVLQQEKVEGPNLASSGQRLGRPGMAPLVGQGPK